MIIVRAISRIVFFFLRHRYGGVSLPITASVVLVAVFSLPQLALATIVRMETTLGTIDIELYDDQAPKTVANFLRYAGRGDYTTNSFIHRSVPGFILQGGGYAYVDFFGQPFYIHIPEDAPVQNEFSPSRSNLRGTIAMAKLGGNPDSATSEWFFNLSDTNAANLDFQNGGFTVFGHVLAGMNVVDAIASVPIFNAGATNPVFTSIPLINYDPAAGVGMQPNNLVMVTRIPNIASTRAPSGAFEILTADVDMTFNSVGAVDTATALSRVATFKSPPNSFVDFKSGMFTLSMTGTMGPAGRSVTLYDGTTVRPTRYYSYGPTLNDPAPHWYDFSFDGETGAEIMSDRIILHFVDGKRGDDDLTANNSITHTGAQAVVTENANSSSQAGGGCSIVTTPSNITRSGDWIVVSLFLAFVALVRRRAQRNRIQHARR
jgi:cyclophilin family peptidyl-prolyl cis-trans isomerase